MTKISSFTDWINSEVALINTFFNKSFTIPFSQAINFPVEAVFRELPSDKKSR